MNKKTQFLVVIIMIFPLAVLAQGPPPPPPPPGLPVGSAAYFLLVIGLVFGIIEIRKSS